MGDLSALRYTKPLLKYDYKVHLKKMKVIWTLASRKAFDRPTSFGRLRWAGASTLIGDRSVLLWEASSADVQACPHSIQSLL